MIIVCQNLVQLYLNKITLKDGKEGKQNPSESVVFIFFIYLSYGYHLYQLIILVVALLYRNGSYSTQIIVLICIVNIMVNYHLTHLDVNMKERTLALVFIDISIITGNTNCNLENIASTQATFTGKFCYFAISCFESITHSIIII